jgi:hypothetical protein
MTTWTIISNAAVAVGGIPSSSTVTALRDNPSAMAETSSGAPVVFAGWHPVDKVTVGDGKTGLIYDYAVSGVVAEVVCPDFQDGYEYRVIGHMLESNYSGQVRLGLYSYFETDAVYRRVIFSGQFSSINSFGMDLEIPIPRVSKVVHMPKGIIFANNSDSYSYDLPYDATIQKISRVKVAFDLGSIDSGQIWFFRRREYASSP